MADLTISSVGIGKDAVIIDIAEFGGSADPGDVVYLDTTDDNKWKKAQHDGTELEAGQNGIGICLTKVEQDGRYGLIQTAGTIYLEATTAEGVTYVVSGTAGNIAVDADVGSGDFKTILGVGGANGTGTIDVFVLNPHVSGQQVV